MIDGGWRRGHDQHMKRLSYFISCLKQLALVALIAAACSGQALSQPTTARQIVDRIDPAKLRELILAAQTQPDVALTNILPTGDNKFRYVFIWPAENPVMTIDRVNRSFTERFLSFASAQRFLTTGYCLTPHGIGLLSTTYGTTKLIMAYRDIEVHRDIGWRETCRGLFVTAAEVDGQIRAAEAMARAQEKARQRIPRGTSGDGVSPFLKGIQPSPD